jgi:O-antigen ligase
MRLDTWSDLPRNVKLGLGALAGVVVIFWISRHLGYFRNPQYLVALIVLEVVLAGLWHFESVFFPLLMGFFFWAGMSLPATGVAFTARWFILAVAAVAGFAVWMRESRQTYTSFHLAALFCVTSALVSAMVSGDPATALLKVLSLFLLFVYGATGARLALRGREKNFVIGLATACEIGVWVTALLYLAGSEVWGNPNSLGAVMGVVAAPTLLWSLLISETRKQHYRRLAALGITGVLLYTSLSRAGMLAAVLACLVLLVGLRQHRLLIQGAFVVFTFVSIAAVVRPSHFDDFLNTFTENVVYKGRRQEGVFGSRKTPWEQTTAVIREHPWFGSGFGTSDMGQFAAGTQLSLRPSEGGLYTKEGGNREHGNSYLAMVEYLGLLGVIPFTALLFLLVRMIFHQVLWMRRTSNPYHPAIPIAMVLLAGMVHAFFEDWLVAVGYYLCVYFWICAFWLVDLMPAHIPSPVRSISSAHPQSKVPGTLLVRQ